jgi:hypothetical protein
VRGRAKCPKFFLPKGKEKHNSQLTQERRSVKLVPLRKAGRQLKHKKVTAKQVKVSKQVKGAKLAKTASA